MKRCVVLQVEMPVKVTAYDVQQAMKKLLPCVMDVGIEADVTVGNNECLMTSTHDERAWDIVIK